MNYYSTVCGLLDIYITIQINSTSNYYAWGKLFPSSMGIEGSLYEACNNPCMIIIIIIYHNNHTSLEKETEDGDNTYTDCLPKWTQGEPYHAYL